MWQLPQIHVLAFGGDFFPRHARWYHSRHESHAREVWPSSTEPSASLSHIGHIHRSHASHVKYFLTRYTSMPGSVILAGRRSWRTSTLSLSIKVPNRRDETPAKALWCLSLSHWSFHKKRNNTFDEVASPWSRSCMLFPRGRKHT